MLFDYFKDAVLHEDWVHIQSFTARKRSVLGLVSPECLALLTLKIHRIGDSLVFHVLARLSATLHERRAIICERRRVREDG